MELKYVPLLDVQRELYALPRGFERFREYLNTMVDAETSDLKLPLVAMNPMGKDHLAVLLEQLIALDADGAGAAATAQAAAALAPRYVAVPDADSAAQDAQYSVTTVLCDDALGGWTNRYTTDFGYRFRGRPYHRREWCVTLLWSSERYDRERVAAEVQASIFRLAFIRRHGYGQTLGDLLAQEAFALGKAGLREPNLEADDLAYTAQVLTPLLESTDYSVQMAALYGDTAARELGYTPLGLSPGAGLAWARQGNSSPAIPWRAESR